MIVCLCRRVSDRDIRRAVQSGVRDFSELQDETGVASNCASCHDCAKEIFDQACAQSACAPVACAAHESVARPMIWAPASYSA